MKKGLLTFITIFITAAMLAACGSRSSVPEGMSEETYNSGVSALEIMENYSSNKITDEEAKRQLDEITNQLYEESKTIEDEYKEKNLIIMGYLTFFEYGKTSEAEEFLRDELKK